MTDYIDPVLALARDPNLSKEKAKTSRLIQLIHGFPVVERKVSRLCLLSLTILQTLEKIELTLRNWAFMSLNINSANHFDTANPDEIKVFNNSVSLKVITSCQELTGKLNKISADIDFITNALKSLSPIEFISDSGTLLTSLTLRSIKLKDELRDKITIAYLKAKLITIGTDLETMLGDASDDHLSTVTTYKQFVVSLLKQLNNAIDNDDAGDRNECLAVISDMEQMFEVFKLERAQSMSESETDTEDTATECIAPTTECIVPKMEYDDYESSDEGFSTMHSTYTLPMVHSITRPLSAGRSPEASFESTRRGSISSMTSTNVLQRSTISEELPYLMSAFNLAKTIEQDLHHFKEEEDEDKSDAPVAKPAFVKQFPSHRTNLPDSSLYIESHIKLSLSTPSSYLYANNSLLSRLGIRPQVITTDKHLADNTSTNTPQKQLPQSSLGLHLVKEDKENRKHVPLTKENLESHNLSSLSLVDAMPDYVE